MENTYICDRCKESVNFLDTKKLLNMRYCPNCISAVRSERQKKLRIEAAVNKKRKALSNNKIEREKNSLEKRKAGAKKYSLDAALEYLANFGANTLSLKHNPLRLKRNEYIYFIAGKSTKTSFSISLALTTQRIFTINWTVPKKSNETISLPFSMTNYEHFSLAKQTILSSFTSSFSKKLEVQPGLNTISLSTVIAIDTPEHNIDYSVWGIDIHLNHGKNISYFFKNSRSVHRFYTLLAEMVDRLNDPIDKSMFSPRRERIPDDGKIAVWRRDNGSCVRCGSRENLEYDHIIPLSKGGSNTFRNIELLCENCNRIKSNKIT